MCCCCCCHYFRVPLRCCYCYCKLPCWVPPAAGLARSATARLLLLLLLLLAARGRLASHPGGGIGSSETTESLTESRLIDINDNDPAAGSPTATLLRLLLPLAAGHRPVLILHTADTRTAPRRVVGRTVRSPNDSIQPPSVATTGGVYKWQGHNRSGLMTQAY